MGDMIDRAELSEDQRVEFHEGGRVWIVEGGIGECARTIQLSAAAALRLFDALRLYEDDLASESRIVRVSLSEGSAHCMNTMLLFDHYSNEQRQGCYTNGRIL